LSSSETKDEMQQEIDKAKKKYGVNYDEKILSEKNEVVKGHKEKSNTLDAYLKSQRPETFTTKYIEQEADKILVSFKAGKKVATTSKYKAAGKNEATGVIVPRGALHEQSVYGKIKVTDKDKSLKYLFENPTTIIDKQIKNLIEIRLQENDNDAKKALTSLKKHPIYLDEKQEKVLEKADCFRERTVLKYGIQNIKVKDVPFIVDEKVKILVKTRLEAHNGKEKEAFKEVLWFNEAKQIPIRTVRLFTDLEAVEAIKKDENGKEIGFAKTGNNHHIAIYKDANGKQIQHLCTFWHAVERKKYKIPYIIKNTSILWNDILNKELPQTFLEKLPVDGLEMQLSMQQNEMFVLGLSKEAFEEAIQHNNKSILSKHLYLVWKLSFSDIWFRHHLETKVSDLDKTEGAKESNRYFRFKSIGALMTKNPTKVRINHLGEITKIGE
jgi:CRISPR-associated endonuclease Csn1